MAAKRKSKKSGSKVVPSSVGELAVEVVKTAVGVAKIAKDAVGDLVSGKGKKAKKTGAKKKGAARKKKAEATASDAEGAPKRTRKQKAAAA